MPAWVGHCSGAARSAATSNEEPPPERKTETPRPGGVSQRLRMIDLWHGGGAAHKHRHRILRPGAPGGHPDSRIYDRTFRRYKDLRRAMPDPSRALRMTGVWRPEHRGSYAASDRGRRACRVIERCAMDSRRWAPYTADGRLRPSYMLRAWNEERESGTCRSPFALLIRIGCTEPLVT